MKKLLLSLLAVVATCISASAIKIDLTFGTGLPSEGWSNSYTDHEYETDDFKLEFTKFNKQSSTITDCPVTKEGNLVITLKNGKTFETVNFKLEQWGTKDQHAIIKYYNGTEYVDFNPQIISTSFEVEASDIPEGVSSIMLDLSYSSDIKNQVGVREIEYTVVGEESVKEPKFTPAGGRVYGDETVEIVSETEEATIYYTINDGDILEYTTPISFNEDGTYEITAFAALNDATSDVVSYTFIYRSEMPALMDILTATGFNAGSSYDKLEWTSDLTGVTYNAQMMMDGSGNMQIRSKNNNSGIVTTENPKGYVIKSVTIKWASNTAASRQLAVYTSDTNFSTPEDLYATGLEATFTLDYQDTALEQEVSDEPIAIGFRSVDSAQYIEYIEIEWAAVETPTAPVVAVGGTEVVDLSQPIDLNQGSVTVTLTADEGHHIYHKHVPAETVEHAMYFEGEEEDPHAGFTHVANNTAEVVVSQNGTLTYYSFHPEKQLKSEPVSISFFNGETTSISEINAADKGGEVYDLQGRRVLAPARGLYIINGKLQLSK